LRWLFGLFRRSNGRLLGAARCVGDQETSQIVSGGLNSLTANKSSFSLPNVPSQNAISIFETEKLVVHVEGEFAIVGDLHGHALDLLRVVIQFDLPAATKYIFLGDYVGRGDFLIHTTLYSRAIKM
jgi:protein phosphatase